MRLPSSSRLPLDQNRYYGLINRIFYHQFVAGYFARLLKPPEFSADVILLPRYRHATVIAGLIYVLIFGAQGWRSLGGVRPYPRPHQHPAAAHRSQLQRIRFCWSFRRRFITGRSGHRDAGV